MKLSRDEFRDLTRNFLTESITGRKDPRRLYEGVRYNPQLMGGSDDDPMVAVYNKTAPFIYDLLQTDMPAPSDDESPMDNPDIISAAATALRQLADDLESEHGGEVEKSFDEL